MNMRRLMAVLAGAALFALSGCASEDTAPEGTTTSQSAQTSTTTSTTTSSTTSSSSKTSEPEPPPSEDSVPATPTPDAPAAAVSEVPASSPQQSAVIPRATPTTTLMNPEEEFWQVCYSGTPDQWPNYVNPATGCGSTLNPYYVEPQPDREFVECVFAGGSWTDRARYSDGTYEFHPDCKALQVQQFTENPYRCMSSDARVPEPSQCPRGAIYDPPTG